MADFSDTVQHIADGRAAAQRVLEEMVLAEEQQGERTVAPRRSSIRIWDRHHRAA